MGKKESNFLSLILLILILILGMIGFVKWQLKIVKPTSIEKAGAIASKYLKEKYQEELKIVSLGGHSGKYWGTVLAKKYEVTSRRHDSYVRAAIIVEGSTVLEEHYQTVILREELVNKEIPKLKEIFGENVLPIFDRVTEGAIYIFGSIENEKDINKYQEGIFDYVQHLKSVDNFEFVKLAFIVIDERVLEDDFYDLEIKKQLIDAKNESKTEKEFLVKRDKIMSQIKVTSIDKSDRIEWIDRGELKKNFEYYGYSDILGTTVISPKMMESNPVYLEMYSTEVGKKYDKKEEIHMERAEKYFFKRD